MASHVRFPRPPVLRVRFFRPTRGGLAASESPSDFTAWPLDEIRPAASDESLAAGGWRMSGTRCAGALRRPVGRSFWRPVGDAPVTSAAATC